MNNVKGQSVHIGFRAPADVSEFIESLGGRKTPHILKALRVYRKLLERKKEKELEAAQA